MRYRAGDRTDFPTEDETPDQNYTQSVPATDRRYRGAAFQPQDLVGVRLTDPTNDRVDYMAGEDGKPISTPQWSLPADLNGMEDQTAPMIGANPSYASSGIRYFHAHDDNPTQQIIEGLPGSWYPTLRDTAGFPLPAVSDAYYGNMTNDVIGDDVNDVAPALTMIGARQVTEKPQQIPLRYSGHPITNQVERPWDVLLGSWPWTGEKAEASQPVVATPLFFAEPIPDGLPSPTGAAGAMWPNTVDMAPGPLTWRAVPSPWDDGDGRNSYVDAGTLRTGR